MLYLQHPSLVNRVWRWMLMLGVIIMKDMYEFSGLDSSLMETGETKKTWLRPTPVQFVIIPFNEGLWDAVVRRWSSGIFLLCCYMPLCLASKPKWVEEWWVHRESVPSSGGLKHCCERAQPGSHREVGTLFRIARGSGVSNTELLTCKEFM